MKNPNPEGTSGTARTDAAKETIYDRGMTEWVPAEISEQLERELTHWKGRFDTAQERQDKAERELAEAKAELKTLKLRLKEASASCLRGHSQVAEELCQEFEDFTP